MNTLETWIVIVASFIGGAAIAGALIGAYMSKQPANYDGEDDL